MIYNEILLPDTLNVAAFVGYDQQGGIIKLKFTRSINAITHHHTPPIHPLVRHSILRRHLKIISQFTKWWSVTTVGNSNIEAFDDGEETEGTICNKDARAASF